MILSLNGRQKEIFWLFFMPPQKFSYSRRLRGLVDSRGSKNNKIVWKKLKGEINKKNNQMYGREESIILI